MKVRKHCNWSATFSQQVLFPAFVPGRNVLVAQRASVRLVWRARLCGQIAQRSVNDEAKNKSGALTYALVAVQMLLVRSKRHCNCHNISGGPGQSRRVKH